MDNTGIHTGIEIGLRGGNKWHIAIVQMSPLLSLVRTALFPTKKFIQSSLSLRSFILFPTIHTPNSSNRIYI